MADIREQILTRLAIVCAGVTGVVASARNKLDVPGLARPALIMQDGATTWSGKPERTRRHRFSQVQLMEIHPVLELRLRADTGDEAGALASLFFGRVLNAVIGDSTLQSLVTEDGDIRLESYVQPEPTPESKEPRATFEFVFLYPLRRSDLAA
jgi:hypothetical protein